MNRTILLITLLAPTMCLAQQPSTLPAMRYASNFVVAARFDRINVRLRLADGSGDPRLMQMQIMQAVGFLTWPLDSHGAALGMVVVDETSGFTLGLGTERSVSMALQPATNTSLEVLFADLWKRVYDAPRQDQAARFRELIQPEFAKINRQMVEQLRALVRSEPAITPDDRAKRIEAISQAQRSLEIRMHVLRSLSAAQPDAPKRLAEKLRQLHDIEQGLQMRLAAQEARRKALQVGLAELKNQAEVERKEDPVAAEILKIIDLREREVARARQMVAQGVTSAAELAQAEANLAETRLRLMERQAAIGKGGKGELMDRLTDELAMVSIDTTDLQIQISQLRSEIAANDPAKLSGAALDDLLKREPGLVPGTADKMPPLFQELEKQAAELRLEWLKLVVDEVEIVPGEAAPAPLDL